MPFDFLALREFPGAAWLYLSFPIAVAVFFRFERFWSLRNWDLVTLFLLFPGLLATSHVEQQTRTQRAPSVAETDGIELKDSLAVDQHQAEAIESNDAWRDLNRLGYIWLFIGTGYFAIRCLIDLSIRRRTRFESNLNLAGIVFLVVAFSTYLVLIVLTRDPEETGRTGARVASSLLAGQTRGMPQYVGADPATVLLMMPPAAVHRGLVQSGFEQSEFDTKEFESTIVRSADILGHILMLVGLFMVGWGTFDSLGMGLGLMLIYLLTPAVAIHSLKLDHLIPSVLILWAVYFHRSPIVTGMLFGLASISFYPLFLLPAWASYYWRDRTRRFLLSFTCATSALWLTVYLVPPLLSFRELWRTSLSSKVLISSELATKSVGFWTESTQIYRLPIFLLFFLLVVGSVFLPPRKKLTDILALSTCLILCVQFWYADRGGTYVLWYLPLLLIVMLRPSTPIASPPAPNILPTN